MAISKVCVRAILVIFAFWGSQVSYAQNTVSQSDFASKDCSGSVPTGYTRIFVAYRSDGKPGGGSPSDPFDGSTADKFDTILRSRSESAVHQLIVCIGPGTFQTEGDHDYVLGKGHLDKSHPAGFTVNDGWRVHGAAVDRTTLRLIDLFTDPSTGKYLKGILISINDPGSAGVEISDLTLDDNYPALKPRYRTPIELMAILLRSNRGHEWVHDIRVTNASGEIAEAFIIEISSFGPPSQSQGNLVENVTMDHWAGGRCTAITIVNSGAEVRNNTVTGYQVGYGGWTMSNVNFHDNKAIETPYGFNIDSYQNTGIIIAHNQIVHPLLYGFVVGGNGNFSNFSITDNTVTVGPKTLYGLVFQGNVRGARVLRNKIIADPSTSASNALGFLEKNAQNVNNIFQENIITGSFKSSLQGSDCLWGNVSDSGQELNGLRNTQNTRCQADQ
jgi:hypothetical protein